MPFLPFCNKKFTDIVLFMLGQVCRQKNWNDMKTYKWKLDGLLWPEFQTIPKF